MKSEVEFLKNNSMKKYVVLKPFSVLEKHLFVPGDIVYAEPIRLMTNVYLPKTRKLAGKIATDKFNECVIEIPS